MIAGREVCTTSFRVSEAAATQIAILGGARSHLLGLIEETLNEMGWEEDGLDYTLEGAYEVKIEVTPL